MKLLQLLAITLASVSALAAPPDFSALEQKPVETKAPAPEPAGATRGLTRGATRAATPATPKTTTRGYDATRGKVTIEEPDGTRKELPYVVLPILFKVNTATLLDTQSEENLRTLAAKLLEPQFSGAKFIVEGHTSTEGSEADNLVLSEKRAQRVFELLTTRFGVEAARLSAKGFGERFPEVPEFSTQDQQRNRRVLVVREQ